MSKKHCKAFPEPSDKVLSLKPLFKTKFTATRLEWQLSSRDRLYNRLYELGLESSRIWHDRNDVDDSKNGVVIACIAVNLFGTRTRFETVEHLRGKLRSIYESLQVRCLRLKLLKSMLTLYIEFEATESLVAGILKYLKVGHQSQPS